MKTGVMTYNVKERFRSHTGQNRNFDVSRLCSILNSPSMQESVRHRDVQGYKGHWPRIAFGMRFSEGGVLDGRQVSVEPAIVTTMLRGSEDGTIEHEAEFLDTVSGRMAQREFNSKVGGFSSAIDAKSVNGVDVPTAFHGFDWVSAPNYTKNRPYEMRLDAATEGETVMYLDGVEASGNPSLLEIYSLYDSLQVDYKTAQQTLDNLAKENEQLFSLLMQKRPDLNPNDILPMLDAAHIAPLVRITKSDTMAETAAMFKSARKWTFEAPDGGEREPKFDAATQRYLDRALR